MPGSKITEASAANMPEFEIATVDLEGRGRIGICHLPGRYAPLNEDIAKITAWNPQYVLTMTEQEEMDALGCSRLGELIQEAGIKWLHLPVPDYGGLEGNNLDRWPAVSGSVHACLDAGGAIVVHCRGGVGRSGMIALRLLVERGEEPDLALQRLRSVRPGAVETKAQLAWSTLQESSG